MGRSQVLVLAALAVEHAGCRHSSHGSPDAPPQCTDLIVPTCPSGQPASVFDEFDGVGAQCGNTGALTSTTHAPVSEGACALALSVDWNLQRDGSIGDRCNCAWRLSNVCALVLHIDPPILDNNSGAGFGGKAVVDVELGAFPTGMVLLENTTGGPFWYVAGAGFNIRLSEWVRFRFDPSGVVKYDTSADGAQWMAIAEPGPTYPTYALPGSLSVGVRASGGTHDPLPESATATVTLHDAIFVCP